MKIIIVGGAGTIGKKVTADLKKDHEIIIVARNSGDVKADITDPAAVEAMFKSVGSFDALVSIAGSGYWGPLKTMTPQDYKEGLNSKFLGQINLVLIGQHYINPKGSFTLTSGILAEDPVVGSGNLGAINGAVNSFVLAAALEMENNVRINVVSPGVVEDSPELFEAFPGHIPATMDKVVNAYRKGVLGAVNGQIIKAY